MIMATADADINSTEDPSSSTDSEFEEYATPPARQNEIQPHWFEPTVEREEDSTSENVSQNDNSGAENVSQNDDSGAENVSQNDDSGAENVSQNDDRDAENVSQNDDRDAENVSRLENIGW